MWNLNQKTTHSALLMNLFDGREDLFFLAAFGGSNSLTHMKFESGDTVHVLGG